MDTRERSSAREDRQLSTRALRGLDWLNFFLADVRDGLGPYLAIYLISVRGPDGGWNEATTGLVMTIAGIAGLLAQTPAGALIDRTRHKRTVVIVGAVAVTLSCLALPLISDFYIVAITQSVAGVAGAIFPPALAAITLGVVGPRMFSKRIGRNEAFNHGGNAASAAIAGSTAYFFGPVVVFWLMAMLAVFSIGAMLLVPAGSIDDKLARGCDENLKEEHDAPSGLRMLLQNKYLLLFAAIAALFHLSNAAMLTSVGQLLTHTVGKDHATTLIAVCIVAAQLVMVPVAITVGAKVDDWGRKPIFLVAFGVLAARGVLYTASANPVWLVAIQCLDGIGAGIYGALFAIVVADLTRGTGRFNVSQGAIATAQGLGASLSATLAGLIIVSSGYSAAFLTLAAIAGLGFALYLVAMPETFGFKPPELNQPGGALRQPSRRLSRAMLVFAHLGDLHIVDARQQNARDLLAIASQIELECAENLDFVLLPGDNADNGTPSQYAIVATAMKMLSVPFHAIPGDHDVQSGNLDAFHAGLAPDRLPKAITTGDVRCIFLDMSGPGRGGPDFRLGPGQFEWLKTELSGAKGRSQRIALFMHSYPEELTLPGEREVLTNLIAGYDVALVDMGHTHYNELSNDGRTIFAATRSTGQIEEGPVGYALASIDQGIVSWRFKLLDDPFPFVLITAPADHRLMRASEQVVDGLLKVRAVVFGRRRAAQVEARVDDGPWIAMQSDGSDRAWCAEMARSASKHFTLTVRAYDETGRPGIHIIRPAGPGFSPRKHRAVGSDAASIGAWPENGIFGTQLGPNRNAKPPAATGSGS